jgi:methylglyoxal/glyoxal reductase
MKNQTAKIKLNNGIEMPLLGLGVFKLQNGGEIEEAVKTALQNGYRSIDTAAAYHNEDGVARGIKASGVPREEIFLTSKIANNDQGSKTTLKAFLRTLNYLKTDYLDLYLIHWPQGKKSFDTWKVMEELYEKGLVRAIGVSNFQVHHLEYLLKKCKVIPAVNQIELHPEFNRVDLVEFCRRNSIQVEAWSPLMRGTISTIHKIQEIASKYNKTPAQVVLRWNIQNSIITIPKSSSPERILSNSQIFDFELSETDMVDIDSLNKNNALHHYRDNISHLWEMLTHQWFSRALHSKFYNALYARINKELGMFFKTKKRI